MIQGVNPNTSFPLLKQGIFNSVGFVFGVTTNRNAMS